MKPTPIWLLAACALQPWASAQDLEIVTADGQVVSAAVHGLSSDGEATALQLSGGQSLRLAEVLELHGPAPRPSPGAIVRLVGGDVLRGAIRKGDDGGETFVVESPVLGLVSVEVDRLREMVLREGVRGRDLVVPESAEEDEAVFLPTSSSRLDTVVGVVHRFAADGVVFEEPGDEPRRLPYNDLAGLALRGGYEREEPASVQLTTRSGDSVGAELLAIADDGKFRFELEGGQTVELPPADISALTLLGDDRLFLSQLQPESVEETSYFDDDGDEPLYRYRVDRTVSGNYLVAGDRAYGRGLGVHSKSRLVFRVPEGFTRFYGLVAVDDEVKELGLRADVDVRVLLGDEVKYQKTGLRSGTPAASLGIVDVTPGALLTLEVDFGAGMDLADRVDWLLPVFLR